uniref:protein-tyrosine-phosphatase n=1 Tax=Plectus sambesii TaxID=2011161 RepID=A0A914W0U6_9BILA
MPIALRPSRLPLLLLSSTMSVDDASVSPVVDDSGVRSVTGGWLARRLRDMGGVCDRRSLFVLDCRSTDDFSRGHIAGSAHISLPTILLKRLQKGTLPACSVVSPRDGREALTEHAPTACIIIVAEEVFGKDSVSALLYQRFVQDGCSAFILRGGAGGFLAQYPQLCVSLAESPEDDQRPALLGPLLQLDRLSLDDEAQAGSSGESCYSSPEDCSTTATLPVGADRPRPPLCEIEKMPSQDCCGQTTRANSFPVEILPFLYLGNAQNASDLQTLEAYGIRYILNVTPNLPNTFETDKRFKYLQISIDDHWSQNLASHFPRAIAFIDEARSKGEGVLVHCLAGISRSVTVTVAYLMQTLHKSLDEAYDLVRAQKSNIAPNFNFMGQLLDFERQLRGASGSPDSGQFSYDDPEAAGRVAAAVAHSAVADDEMHFLSPTTAVNLRKTAGVGDPSTF